MAVALTKALGYGRESPDFIFCNSAKVLCSISDSLLFLHVALFMLLFSDLWAVFFFVKMSNVRIYSYALFSFIRKCKMQRYFIPAYQYL